MAQTASTAGKKSSRLLTPKFRVSFPSVFEKASYNNGTPRYSLVGLFYPKQFDDGEKAKWEAIKAQLKVACQDFFKKPLDVMKQDRSFKIPFHRGNEKDYEGYGDPDMIFFTMANSKRRPQILNIDGEAITSENAEEFYAGCWARASVNPYAFDNIGKGVAIGLGNIQKLKNDQSFEGFTSAEDDFGSDPVGDFDDGDDGLGGDDDDLT